MPTTGIQAPDFELPNQDGKPVRLSDYRGKKVVLFAFPQAFTMGCTAQACSFRDQFPKIETQNAVVLGISPDSPEKLREWKAKHELPYDLLSDPEHKALDEWSAWGKSIFGLITIPRTTRSVWVIDEEGVVLDAKVGITPTESVRRALEVLNQA